jgi:hypothetical protein
MSWIQTYTGKRFDPINPRAEDVDIIDIAHALSMQCRYSGHTSQFLSVAEHCVRVSRAVPPADALWGLLHDAAEAYIGDLAQPLKAHMPAFVATEQKLHAVIAERFGLSLPMPRSVHVADVRMLATEVRDLMQEPPEPWEFQRVGIEPYDEVIVPWSSNCARFAYLERLNQLRDSNLRMRGRND